MNNQYTTILFDLDGTLLDTVGLIISCYRHTFSYAAQKYNVTINISDNQIRGNIGLSLQDSMEIYCGSHNLDVEELINIYRVHQEQHWQKFVRVFDGAFELFEYIKSQQKHIAIVTSRKKETTTLYCKDLGLDQWVDLYITPDVVSSSKPHPESALKAAQLLNTAPTQCLFIGDSVFDIECAKNAGMDSALVPWGAMAEEERKKSNSTYLINKFADLIPQ